jgi:hypothetical protein
VTSNSGISLAAGSVDLVDDDAGSAAFTVSNLIPGASVTRCIVVTYQGSIPTPGPVRVYSGGYTDSGDFSTYLNLTVEEGSGGTFAGCTGFIASSTIESGTLANFGAIHTNYTNGAGIWDPAATPESRTYRITFQLASASPNSEQGQSVTGLTFTWEVQT